MSISSKDYIDRKIKSRQLMIFGKSNDPDSQRVKSILEQYFIPKDLYEWVDIEKRQDCKQLENYFRILCYTDRRKTPYIFISGIYFGSLNEFYQAHLQGILLSTIRPRSSPVVPMESITNKMNTSVNISNTKNS